MDPSETDSPSKNIKTACEYCGTVSYIETDHRDRHYKCPQCLGTLYRPGERKSLVLSFALSGVLLALPAGQLPIMTVDVMGQKQSVTIVEALMFFTQDGYSPMAILTLFTGVIIPMILLSLIFIVLNRKPLRLPEKTVGLFLRFIAFLKEWGMVEVYLISILVAIIKLQKMATLTFEFGLFLFFLYWLCFYLTFNWFNPQDIWTQNESPA